ncbi:hypothetical protein AKJ44_01810 [candidate division MSBL1 archaeon SCGC-AAA261F17]|uniref:MPN domain-containing protein n=2 Tax=candidate division MSBL1 TaxID=215777 RepID=A0A133V664_9EURY|nr:hypothetical protein AKJ44_01810 [candidate division MSBL1 archaeon SCGC-AAA261F17]KXB04007.1 hypothetical protein AKJ48_03485 [candidate division MSBL1 archaeon SCGC-AAA261O19]
MKIHSINREALKLILGASKTSHPNEFAGILRADKGVITEVLLLPGTFSSEQSAIMRLHMMPIDSTACGTVHSHPTPNPEPSQADLELFNKFGEVHIIVASPYKEESWCAYDHQGRGIELKVTE